MRGKQRSRPIESIVAEAERLAGEGVKELNLISQDTMNYGVDLGMRGGLTSLLRALVIIPGVRWIRPFYLYPQQVTDELIDLYAGEEKIAKYLDMPLQHINDGMLRSMHRLGDRAAITKLVDRLRHRIPGLTFRTAFIVGFPGETAAAFDELKQYVADMEFDRVAVFLYSDEEGTPAVELSGKQDRRIMEERRAELLEVQEAVCLKKSRARIGSLLEVLVDGPSEDPDFLWEARHEGLAPEIDGVVYLNGLNGADSDRIRPNRASSQAPTRRLPKHGFRRGDSSPPAPGSLVKAKITDATTYDLIGRLMV
jgi:ribosomal protein S12 methylthiotransferase